ncbi:uncharacterized protein LOC117328732 [Pecten maximus]|uniref:uncharacterized protein LOC117328732 n=1 Tax=Pecten maximus TaxID=6579 RepID=UPI0014590F13|nr:uncharacterized protein LOC117328732 [Pecten maximus]XP_033742127.1 uncharacterized protein LOC117328732 [Pecten maximus]XP_033742128.1 uncharacterized protein LOC117328732 [Pecten maximus]XP_033742129.1 uncharacterized protein LOC117328732 [Pecten maximus]
MDEKMDEEALSRNNEVCQMLRQSLLEICRNHYTALADMEVDAIICLSAINSSQQNIVKIHQVVPRENFKNTSTNGIHASKVESNLGIARGIQMQIKKRKRLMCRQKHNFRVKLNAAKVDAGSSSLMKPSSETNKSSSSRRKMKKSSVTQYQPWSETKSSSMSIDETNSAENTLFVTRDKQGRLLRVSQLQVKPQGDHPGNDEEEELQDGCNSSTEEKVAIKEEPIDDDYGDNDTVGCGQMDKNENRSEAMIGKSDSDSQDIIPSLVPKLGHRRREPRGKFMIYNKELGTVETEAVESQSTDDQDEQDMDEDERETSKSHDCTENSSESFVVKTEPEDPEYNRPVIENPPMIIQSVQGNTAFEVGKTTNQVSLLRNCLIKTGNDQEVKMSSMFLDSDRNSQLTKFPTDNDCDLHYTSPSTSVIDFSASGGNDWKKGYSLLGEERSDDEGLSQSSGCDTPFATSNREPAVLRRTKKKKVTEPKLVSLLHKPTVMETTSSGLVGAMGQSHLSPLRISGLDNSTKSNISSPVNYSSSNQNFDDSDPIIRGEIKQFYCEKCGTGFASRKSKMRHEKFTCGNHTFECSVCGKFYSRADSKQRHMLKMHGVKIMPSQLGIDPLDMNSSENLDDNMTWL